MTDQPELSREETTVRLADSTGRDPAEIRRASEEFEIEAPQEAEWEYIE